MLGPPNQDLLPIPSHPRPFARSEPGWQYTMHRRGGGTGYTFFLANLESQQKSERVKSALAAKRRNLKNEIFSGTAYGWLRPNESRTGFTLVPQAARIVQRIYDLAETGLGVYSIVRTLNAEHVPTIGRKQKNSITTWTPTYVRDLLLTRAVVGEYQPHRMEEGEKIPDGLPVKDYYPAVITEAQWQRVRDAMSGRRIAAPKGRASANLFQGLLVCVNDGSSLKYTQSGAGPYGKDSLPHARARELWKALHECGDLDRCWSNDKWKAIRDFFSGIGYIDWQDQRYYLGEFVNGEYVKGQACKWHLADDVAEVINGEEAEAVVLIDNTQDNPPPSFVHRYMCIKADPGLENPPQAPTGHRNCRVRGPNPGLLPQKGYLTGRRASVVGWPGQACCTPCR
jgi:hypothetical protein